jgi:predicted phosphohydrolase
VKNIIIATSDLHVGHTNIDDVIGMTRAIEELVCREGLRVLALLVLGDIGESLKDIEMTLAVMGDLATVRVYVPGNHDLYDTERMGSSLCRYREHLPTLAARHGYAWGIQDRPIIIDDTAIITTSAWPRPETRIRQIDLDPREVQAARDELPDGRWITRDLRDDVLSDEQLRLFRQALAAVPKHVHRVIVATHYPIMIEQLRREMVLLVGTCRRHVVFFSRRC